MLYRYRSLEFIDREIDALKNSYLYAASFDKMNDPMEAFYELGGGEDVIINSLFSTLPLFSSKVYSIHKNYINQLGLLSFSKSNLKYPMWAYYANNFSGICLKFDKSVLMQGSLNGEIIIPITYSNETLPPISMLELIGPSQEQVLKTILLRLTRKRKDWQHEDEVRIVTGKIGKKYYFENALKKIFLGPKIDEKHKDLICSIFENRPTEVLMGKIEGYELKFETIKPAKQLEKSEKVGQGFLVMDDALYYSEQEVLSFLDVPFNSFESLCKQLTMHPNMEKIHLINIEDNMLHFHIEYKTRGTPIPHTHLYYNKKLNLINIR